MLKNAIRRLAVLFSFGVMLGVGGQAHAFSLPTADCPNNCLTFEDFTVYSMAYLNFLATGSLNVNPQDPFYVGSSGTLINNALVVGSGNTPRTNNTDLALSGGVDNGYLTPENQPQQPSVNFSTVLAPDPGGAGQFSGDGTNSWDIQTSALLQYLGGEDLVFFFNLNETNKGGIDDGQDLYAFLRVCFSGSSGSVCYDLSGNITSPFPGQSADQTTTSGGAVTQDNILPASTDKWAHVHGEICVSPTAGLQFLGPCNEAPFPVAGDSQTVNQNLGDQKAAFALVCAQCNTALHSGDYDVMSVFAFMSHVDNGFDQLFILPITRVNLVPEPDSLVLAGLGLALLAGMVAWRRRRPKA
jgi:MYXO-CTERM domain-containing protein